MQADDDNSIEVRVLLLQAVANGGILVFGQLGQLVQLKKRS